MIKIFALIPLIILFANPSGVPSEVSPVSSAKLASIANGANAQNLYIEYNYWFQGGVSVELHVFGDGRAYYYKKVNSKEYQDAIHYAHLRGARISPYQWSLANCEYGDYEIYQYAELSYNQVQSIVQKILDSNVLSFESELGDTTYHGLNIMLPGQQTRKSTVIPKNDAFGEIASFFKQEIPISIDFQSCSKAEFQNEMVNSISVSGLPVKRSDNENN